MRGDDTRGWTADGGDDDGAETDGGVAADVILAATARTILWCAAVGNELDESYDSDERQQLLALHKASGSRAIASAAMNNNNNNNNKITKMVYK